MSILINEITNIENALLLQASDKEKLFYQYLTKKPIDANIDELGEIDKICFSAFTNTKNEELDRIVERNRKAKPVAGSHFSSNLITLCAFALYDKKVEEAELKHFHSKNGLKEQYILFKVFGDNFYPTSKSLGTNIDKLIDSALVKRENTEGVKNMISALSSCNDLTELYLIQLAFSFCAEIHPNKKNDEENKALKTEFTNFHLILTKRVDKITNWSLGILLLLSICLICYIIVVYWQPWDLEPKLSAFGIVSPLILIMSFLLFRFKKTWEELLTNIKSHIVQKIYKLNNIDYNKITNMLKPEENISI